MGSLNDIKKSACAPLSGKHQELYNFTLKNIRQVRCRRLGYATVRSRQVTRRVV